MKVLKNIALLSLISLLALPLKAGTPPEASIYYNPVLTGAPMLSIIPDARSAGMAEIGLTTSPDAYALYHNISKLAFTDSVWGVSFGYTPWLSEISRDISLSALTGYYRFNTQDLRHGVSASIRYFHIGKALAFQKDTYLPLTIMPYELGVDLGYSIAINKHWAFGATIRYVRSDYNYSSDDVKALVNSVLGDFSTTYQTTLQLGESRGGDLRTALAINNLGGKMSYDGGKTYLFAPTILRLGVGLETQIQPDHGLGVHFEVNKVMAPTYQSMPQGNQSEVASQREAYFAQSAFSALFNSFNDAPGGASEELKEYVWSLGTEYSYKDLLFLRAGYRYQHKEKGTGAGVALGGGLIYQGVKLDLSYFLATQPDSPLNNTLRLTLSFDM